MKITKMAEEFGTAIPMNDAYRETMGVADEHNVREDMYGRDMREAIARILPTLTEREQTVLKYRFGLEDGYSRTLKEVGDMFGITGETIRKIEAKALRKLRHPERLNTLEGLLPGAASNTAGIKKVAGEDWEVTDQIKAITDQVVVEIESRGGAATKRGENRISVTKFVLDDAHSIPLDIRLYEGTYHPGTVLINATFGSDHPVPVRERQPFEAKAIVDAIVDGFMYLVNYSKTAGTGRGASGAAGIRAQATAWMPNMSGQDMYDFAMVFLGYTDVRTEDSSHRDFVGAGKPTLTVGFSNGLKYLDMGRTGLPDILRKIGWTMPDFRDYWSNRKHWLRRARQVGSDAAVAEFMKQRGKGAPEPAEPEPAKPALDRDRVNEMMVRFPFLRRQFDSMKGQMPVDEIYKVIFDQIAASQSMMEAYMPKKTDEGKVAKSLWELRKFAGTTGTAACRKCGREGNKNSRCHGCGNWIPGKPITPYEKSWAAEEERRKKEGGPIPGVKPGDPNRPPFGTGRNAGLDPTKPWARSLPYVASHSPQEDMPLDRQSTSSGFDKIAGGRLPQGMRIPVRKSEDGRLYVTYRPRSGWLPSGRYYAPTDTKAHDGMLVAFVGGSCCNANGRSA
jgi:DNA-binding CsgD family transcriptional regulator